MTEDSNLDLEQQNKNKFDSTEWGGDGWQTVENMPPTRSDYPQTAAGLKEFAEDFKQWGKDNPLGIKNGKTVVAENGGKADTNTDKGGTSAGDTSEDNEEDIDLSQEIESSYDSAVADEELGYTGEITPAPEELNAEQIAAAKELIEANPPGKLAQERIATLKEKYPEEFKDVKPKSYNELTPKEKKKRNSFLSAVAACEKPDSITTGRTVILADPCKDTTFDKMQAQLDNFFSKITGPGNAILNMANEIKNVSNIMSGVMSGFVNKMTGAVNDKLQGLISKGMSKLSAGIFSKVSKAFPYSAALSKVTKIQEGLMGPISGLLNGVFCVGKKIMGALGGVISDLISAAIPRITNPAACAVQQIIGAINNKVINMIDSVTGSLLGPVTKVLGFAFSAKSFLSGGINILKGLGSLGNCASKSKCPSSNKFVIGKGLRKASSSSSTKKNFDKVFSGTALTQAAANKATAFEKEYGSWEVFGSPLKDASNMGPCYTGNPTSCGGATVELFGGGGIGASGKAILGNFIRRFDKDDLFGEVQRTASIVGIEITNPGSGYTSDPIVTIDDECNQGRGAYAQAHVDQNPNSPTYGQVTSFTMITAGVNYPAADEEVPLFIDKVVIENPGYGYKDTDTLDDFQLDIINGQVVGGTLKNQIAYDDLPDLNIDSETGVGAILNPVMSKTRPQGEIVKVIDCVS